MSAQFYRKMQATDFSRDFRQVVEIVETELKPPGPGEVLVKNLYAGVNASDVNISAGVYLKSKTLPFDVGVESIGEVAAVGKGVQELKPGQAVMCMAHGCGYREYFTTTASAVYPALEATPAALTLGLSGVTAAIGLLDVGELQATDTVLITAAAGATGSYAVQLAKNAGAHVIGTCGGPAKARLLRELGCDRAIDYRKESLDAVLREEYPQGVSLVYEGVGGEMFDTAIEHLAVRGRLLVVGYISEYDRGAQPVMQPRIYERLLWKSAQIRAYVMSQYASCIAPRFTQLVQAYRRGELRAMVDDTQYDGLESVCDAVEALHAGKNTGKVVVRLHP